MTPGRRTCRTAAVMGTIVTIEIVAPGKDDALARAFNWFGHIEKRCTRFDPDSELRRLCARPGRPVAVSPVLYQAVQFALAVAAETDGAFDPTVGHVMEAHGFDREYSTGRAAQSGVAAGDGVSFRDIVLDERAQTIVLARPLLLDLGAVAKGMAIDAAARELRELGDFAIDAGGDLYLSGRNIDGELWTAGIPHPREPGRLVETLTVSNRAICTSGDYERRTADGAGHHIIDPGTHLSAACSSSATVVAPSAMLADALATAAFVLGPADGVALLERLGVEGVIYSPALERRATRGFGGVG